jgi:hypothetical protein
MSRTRIAARTDRVANARAPRPATEEGMAGRDADVRARAAGIVGGPFATPSNPE